MLFLGATFTKKKDNLNMLQTYNYKIEVYDGIGTRTITGQVKTKCSGTTSACSGVKCTTCGGTGICSGGTYDAVITSTGSTNYGTKCSYCSTGYSRTYGGWRKCSKCGADGGRFSISACGTHHITGYSAPDHNCRGKFNEWNCSDGWRKCSHDKLGVHYWCEHNENGVVHE